MALARQRALEVLTAADRRTNRSPSWRSTMRRRSWRRRLSIGHWRGPRSRESSPRPAGRVTRPDSRRRSSCSTGGRDGSSSSPTCRRPAGPTARERTVPEHVDVEVVAVPPVERNLAVTAAGADAADLVAVLLNTGSGPVETEATLSLDGREVARRRVTLPPGAVDVRWDLPATRARVAAVRVADGDGYRWDDTRYVLLGPATPTVVQVVANSGTLDAEAFHLAQALGVAPESRPFDIRPLTPAALAAPSASDWQADVVIVLGTDGLTRPGRGARRGVHRLRRRSVAGRRAGRRPAAGPGSVRRIGCVGGRGSGRDCATHRHPPVRGRGSAPSRVPAVRRRRRNARSGALRRHRPRELRRSRSCRPGRGRFRRTCWPGSITEIRR